MNVFTAQNDINEWQTNIFKCRYSWDKTRYNAWRSTYSIYYLLKDNKYAVDERFMLRDINLHTGSVAYSEIDSITTHHERGGGPIYKRLRLNISS